MNRFFLTKNVVEYWKCLNISGMSIGKVSKDALRKAIVQAINNFSTEADFEVITDFHLHLNSDTGELSIVDDDYVQNTSVVIEEWIDIDNGEFTNEVVRTIKNVIQQLSDEKAFDNVNISKPFSFVLEDNDQETLEELFIVDDDTIILSEEFLKGVDKELDTFLDDLMK